MHNGLCLFVATLVACSVGYADEPTFSASSETESSMKALVERLEARINELEVQVQQLKYAQQQSVIGGGLLEAVERPTNGQRVMHFGWGPLADRTGTTQIDLDRMGVVRDLGGRTIGIGLWGVDTQPVN